MTRLCRTRKKFTGKVYVYDRAECVACKKVRDGARYANLTPQAKVDRLAYKRARARARGAWRPGSQHAEERMALKVRRDAFSTMLRDWRAAGRRPRLPIGAEVMAAAKVESERTGDPLTTALWRARYQMDPAFKAREIERAHRKKLQTYSTREFRSDGTLHGKAVQRLFAAAKGCAYCGAVFQSGRDKTLDHVVPLSRGGMHSILNVVIACRACNTRKGGRTWLAA